MYRESRLDEPELAGIRAALERLLTAHEPYPAIVLDGQRNIVAANRGLAVLTEGVAAHLLESPANSLRIALHPEGMASRIVNFDEVSFYTLEGLSRSIAGTGDEGLKALYRELASYPNVALERPPASLDAVSALALPIRLRRGNGELAFYSSFTTFNTPRNVGLAELSLEAFYPANEETGRILRPC